MASETTVPALIPEPELAPPRRFRTFRDLLRKKIALLAIAYLAIFYACGLIAPFNAPYGLNDQQLTVETRLQPPSADHLLGTDRLGRDMLTRVLYSARTTVVFTIVIVISGGLFLGLAAADLFCGKVERQSRGPAVVGAGGLRIRHR